MTTIKETLRVECPYVRARGYLHETLSDVAGKGSDQPLLLTAPFPIGAVQLEKGVRVRYAVATDPMHFDEPWYVCWDPEPGGMYPSFSGILTVRADDDYPTAILELEGSYAPPLGPAGALFDKTLGRRIAQQTMQALLAKIGTDMTERYRREEREKTSAR